MDELLFIAPAKINLGLEILYKREDGYHELNSLFYRVDAPHDFLRVSESAEFKLTSTDPALPTDGSNLVHRAVQLFAEATNSAPLPLLIDLEKHIPSGAGLGGGSSDAATALKICNERSGKTLSPTALHTLARKLGADVPFFLYGSRSATARGIGDNLEAIELNIPYSILIAKFPGISVNTKEAYAQLKLAPKTHPVDYAAIFRKGFEIKLANAFLQNDFEATVFEMYPPLRELKERLLRLGADYASMSGSGSAIFGLYEKGSVAHQAAEILRKEGMQIFLTDPTG